MVFSSDTNKMMDDFFDELVKKIEQFVMMAK